MGITSRCSISIHIINYRFYLNGIILADVIIPMAPVIPARLKDGGYFITSGIIDFKENEVKEAIEAAGLKVVEINHQGEWVNITARKVTK